MQHEPDADQPRADPISARAKVTAEGFERVEVYDYRENEDAAFGGREIPAAWQLRDSRPDRPPVIRKT